MSTNQGLRVASIIANYTFTNENTHDGYYMQAFTEEGFTDGDFNGRMIAWLQARNSSTDDDINNLKQLDAERLGFDNWNAITDLY
jgi:hypothetical protein